ncbi:MAG: porin, partial [Edaphobacter sp.]
MAICTPLTGRLEYKTSMGQSSTLKYLFLGLLFLPALPAHNAAAQQIAELLPSNASPQRDTASVPEGAPTFFPHPDRSRFLLSGQANIIFQGHGAFHSPYEGTNSFLSRGEYKTSLLGTLFLGAQLR